MSALIRIVKMEFRPAEIERFLAIFAERRERIRAFPGCTHLALWRDQQNGHVFFTYSHWESAAALEAYRQSVFFKSTWALTKPLFAARAAAWSVAAVPFPKPDISG